MRNPIPGTTAADLLAGTYSADLFDAMAGDDTINASGGNDLIYGGDGTDVISAEDGNDRAYGGDGNDRIYGGYGGDTLYGGQGSDVLVGEYDGDVMYGGSGNDFFVTGYSYQGTDDQVYGGNGDDTITFLVRHGGIADGGNGFDAVTLFWYDNFGPLDPITLTLTGPTPNASYGTTTVSLISIEQIKLQCYAADDSAYGGAGDDELSMHLGANIAYGNDGNDDLHYIMGAVNIMDGGTGTDTLHTGLFSGGPLVFTVTGTTASDGYGSTLVNFESFWVGGAYFGDVATLGDGADRFDGHFGNDTGYGGAGNDRLDGGREDDSLFGGTGRDVLVGGSGDDLLSGGDDKDVLIGGLGVDTMTGGTGRDEFRFRLPDQYPDFITDFVSGTDQISIFGGAFDASLLPGPLDPSQFAIGAASGPQAQFFVVFSTTDNSTALFWDRNGDGFGALIQMALLEGTTTFTIDDILLI